MDDTIPNELQPVEPPPAPAPDPPLPFLRPADYYSSPESRLRPLFPRWVPIGCGWVALVFVVLLFVAGAFAPRSGAILDWALGKMEEDLSKSFTNDVTIAQRKAFAAEMQTMRLSARAGKLKLDRMQTFLRAATELDADEKVDHAEADKLTAAVQAVNRSVR